MRKFIFSMAVMTATFFASCSKDSEVPTPPTPDSGTLIGRNMVTLTLTDDNATRAVSASAEAWEKSLSSLTIFAFDEDDNLLVRRDLNSAELSSKSVSFALPKSSAGTECSFFTVANIDASGVTTKEALMAMLESSASSYNGTYAEVTSKALRSGGFVMSGSTNKTIGAVNTTTNIAVTIKRTVAKVALELTKGASFTASYPTASLTFKSAKISKAATQTPVISSVLSTGAMSYTHTQNNATPNYLFYIYENGDLAAGNRVLLEVVATFDADGNAETTSDQSEVIYPIELSGDGAGAISRNGLYNIVATINGLVGQDCDVAISVADWETPTTQNVNLGM